MTAPADWTLLTAARLLDGSGAGPLEDAAVLIEGGTIRAIGRRSEVRPPDGAVATVARVRGRDDPARTRRRAYPPRRHRRRDARRRPGRPGRRPAAHPGDRQRPRDAPLRGHHDPRERLDGADRLLGPRGDQAGHRRRSAHGRRGPGGDDHRRSPPLLRRRGRRPRRSSARGPPARQGGRRLHQDHGVGRQHPLLAPAPAGLHRRTSCAAIVDEAHRHERLTAAHAVPNAAIEDCLDAGLDMIIHCSMTDATGAYVYRPDLADRMADGRRLGQPDDARHPRLALVLPRRGGSGAPARRDGRRRRWDELRRLYDDKLDAVRRLHAAGVRLIAGSDSAWGRSPAGRGWLEIDALTDAGLSTAEAIAAGTTGSAAAIGVGDVAGCLEPGRPADLLVVAGDPLADLAVLGDPLDVFQAGRRIVRSREGASLMRIGLLLPQGYFNEFEGWSAGGRVGADPRDRPARRAPRLRLAVDRRARPRQVGSGGPGLRLRDAPDGGRGGRARASTSASASSTRRSATRR